MKIGVIGAGIAGLATSIRLAAKGHQVEVFEANPYPGGKLSSFKLDGYRFDAGPSLFTMPHYVDELFDIAGEKAADHFHYERLPIVCEYFWEDGTNISAHANPKEFAKELEQKLAVPATRILVTLKDSQHKYEVSGKIFLEKSLHKVKTWTNWEVAKAMLRIPSLDLFRSMNSVNEKLLGDPKLVQLFNRFATYNGSNPYKAPGLLTIIPYFEHQIGAYYPKGGMNSISQALYQLAMRKGVKFNFKQRVEKIIVQQKKARALLVNNKEHTFDRIVSNMDVFFTYKHLLKDQKHPQRILKQEKSSSAVIFYWGIKKSFAQLDLHNIFFSQNYKAEFDALSQGRIYEDPTVYVNISSKYSPDDAPKGHENWFTMINAPYNEGQDWDSIIEQLRKKTMDKLSRILGEEMSSLISCEAILDPRSIESKTASHLGALYGTSSNNRMAAFLRHPNFSNRIKHLYFCGGSAHPGGGIPLCLLSAKIVSELLH